MNSRHEHPDHHGHGENAHHGHGRHGARQPERFDPARATLLDDPRRFEYLLPDEIFAMLDAPEGAVVVDFGTGTGTFVIELARRRPDVRVIALDEQPGMLELLRAKPAASQLKNLEPLLTDRIETVTGAADRILAINVLHEVGDDALAQMILLLKPHGSILFIDWDAGIERPVGPPKDHTYTATEARERLEKSRLAVDALKAYRYHFVLAAHPSKAKIQTRSSIRPL